MRIDEAIKTLEQANTFKPTPDNQDLKAALKLGSEALKREEKRRRFAIPDRVDLLSGETKD